MRWRDPEAEGIVDSGICWADEPDEDVGVYYHACPNHAVDQILREGLKPGDGQNWPGQLLPWCKGRMFLAAGHYMGEQWRSMLEEQTGLPFSLLGIRLPPAWERQLRVDKRALQDGMTCSFYLTRRIPPQYITLEFVG